MATQIIRTGSNSQKLVFTMLVAALLLEFGSLTKLQKIWTLAFTAPGTQQPTSTPTSTPGTQYTTLTTPAHPGTAVTV